jgi:hypothetical protein
MSYVLINSKVYGVTENWGTLVAGVQPQLAKHTLRGKERANCNFFHIRPVENVYMSLLQDFCDRRSGEPNSKLEEEDDDDDKGSDGSNPQSSNSHIADGPSALKKPCKKKLAKMDPFVSSEATSRYQEHEFQLEIVLKGIDEYTYKCLEDRTEQELVDLS